MAAAKVNALTNLATPDPTMLMYAGLSPFGVTDDRKVTANALFQEPTANVTDVSLQFGNGVAAAVSAANKGKLIYNNTAGAFQVSLNTAAYTNLLTGAGANTRVAYWTAAATLSSDSAFLWDATNDRLLINVSVANGAAPIDVLSNASAIGQQWRENAGTARVQVQVPSSFGLFGTSSNHDMGFIANNTQFINLEKTGGTVFGSIVPATGTVMVNALVNTDISLVANNAAGSTIEIAKFQVGGSNRFRLLSTGEAIFGLAATATGKLTLSNASGSTLTSLSAGNAASTLNFILPVTDPTAGQFLQAAAPSGGNVTLSWATGTGSTSPAGSNTQVQFNNSGVFGASANLTWISPALTIGTASSTDGILTLASAGAAFTQSFKAGGAPAATNVFRWPNADPTNGQFLQASAPAAGVVTLLWTTVSGGTTINATDTVMPYRSSSTVFSDSQLIHISSSLTELRNSASGTVAQTLNIYGTAANNTASAPSTYVRAAIDVSTTSVSITAQQASSGALTAGTSLNLTAAGALAGATGSAAGGPIIFTSGNAAQLTSGTARGGDITFINGTSVGTASTTALGQIIMPTFGRYDNPTICFNNPAGAGIVRQYGIGMSGGFGYISISAPNISLCAGDSAQSLTAGLVEMNSQTQLAWVAGTSNPPDFTADTGLTRAAAGVVRVTDSTTGQGALLIAPSTATASAPLDVVAQASDAAAQTWREFSAGPARVKMFVPASYGQLGTTTAHAFSLMSNNLQRINIESGGAVVIGTILTATAELMVNSLATGSISLIANNLTGTTVDIADFQVNGTNRYRFLNTGESIWGTANSATGKITLANASGSTLTSISAGNAASTLNFILPVVDPTVGQVLSASAPSGSNVTLSWIANGAPALTATQIGFGDGSNLLSGSTRLIWDNTNRSMTLGESGNSGSTFITLRSTNTASAFITGSAAAVPGAQGGVIFPDIGGDQTQGPGLTWSAGGYGNTSRLYLSLGLNWQGYDTGGQAVRLRKSTATSSQGDVIFELRPNDGYMQLAPFGTSAGNTTELHFLELAANGTNYVAIKGPDSVGSTNPVIVLPSSATPTTNQVLSISGVSSGVITTTWATVSGSGITGTGSQTTGFLVKWATGGSTVTDSLMDESTAGTVQTNGKQLIVGATISTDATNTVASLTSNWTLTKNNANSRTFYGALFQPTFNVGGSNASTTVNVLAVDTVNTAVTGLTINLLNLAYGSAVKFSVDSAGAITFAGVRQAFSPTATVSGLNVGQVTGDPSSLVNGDIWYDSTGNLLRARINGATVSLGAAGGSGITIGTTTVTSGTGTRLLYETSGNVVGEISTLTSDGTIVTFTPTVTTGTGSSSGVVIAANSLTTGTGLNISSSSVSSGNLVSIITTGTAAASNTKTSLNVSTSGANATSAMTTYGIQVANTSTGTTSVNVGIYSSVSGGATNYAARMDGNVCYGGTSSSFLMFKPNGTGGSWRRADDSNVSGDIFAGSNLAGAAGAIKAMIDSGNTIVGAGISSDATFYFSSSTSVTSGLGALSLLRESGSRLKVGQGTTAGYGDLITRQYFCDQTITAGGTTGNQTINKGAGTVNIAAAGTTVTVTCSLCTTSSTVYAVIRTNDTTARIANVVPGSGSFVINIVACTAEVSIGFLVVNQ